MVFRGTTATTANSTASQNDTDIISFSLANKTGGGITATVGIFYGSTITYILYNQAIATATTYIYSGEKIRVIPGFQIFVSVSGSTDYYFTII